MSYQRPDDEYAPSPDVAHRWASRYITGYLQRHPAHSAPDAAAVQKARRWIIVWAALAGIVSGTLIGGAEWWMRAHAVDNWEALGWQAQLPYWAGYMLFAGIVTVLEIGFLYWNSLRGVAQVSRLAGLPYPSGSPMPPAVQLTIHGVSRTALEYPSAGHRIYGVDPHAYLHGWKLTCRAILYRLKVSLSSFVLRLVMRRLLGRLTLRGMLPLLSGPLYALWNGWIAARITQDAYLQARGPALVEQMMEALSKHDADIRALVAQGVGELIMRNQHPHPNLVLLLARLLDSQPEPPGTLQVDWPATLRAYAQLTGQPQQAVLTALSQATLLSGPLRGARQRFLGDVFATCQTPLPHRQLNDLQRRLNTGQDWPS